MLLKTERIVIRDLERKDKDNLYKIVWQKNVVRFMRDWSENNPSAESFNGYIDYHQIRKDSKDIYENKRYAVAVADTDEIIGMVGMGFEDTLNEASCKVAEKVGFELFEKRIPISHKQPNIESDSYYYYRKYRSKS